MKNLFESFNKIFEKIHNWEKSDITEFLNAIGQEEIKFKGKLNGLSAGDYGKIEFSIGKIPFSLEGPALILKFLDSKPKEVEKLNYIFHKALGNPYSFTYFPEGEATTIYVMIED